MKDESQLQIRPKEGDSSLSIWRPRSSLIARGLTDAEALLFPRPIDLFSETLRLAEQGDSYAQYELSEAYRDGYLHELAGNKMRRVSTGVPRDRALALTWCRKAADQLHFYAMLDLGHMYEKGEGSPVDRPEARHWYWLAADIALADLERKDLEWDIDAITDSLGRAAEYGHVAAQRFNVSYYLYEAEKGRPYYQFKLGNLYVIGRGVPQDYVQAHMWLNLAAAASAGDDQKNYSSARDAVTAKMTSQQIADAQHLALEWKPKWPK